MTIYWETVESNLDYKARCDTCRLFNGPRKAELANYTLKGNEFAEHMAGEFMHVCNKHFNELKEAGEV
jgi:hypothetical protein